MRPAWVEIDLDAVRHNVRVLRRTSAPAELCAVVKADGYGHGALEIARAAVDAGATWLAVALAQEGEALRRHGVDVPVLVLSEPAEEEMGTVVAAELRPAVYSRAGIERAAKAVADRGAPPLPVHLKVDTGMHRVGCHPDDALELAELVGSHPELRLEGVWTHCAVADEPDHPFTGEQLRRFDAVLARLREAGVSVPLVHAANSAAALAHPESRRDLVRCGIAVYGVPPGPGVAHLAAALRPALSLRARVSWVRVVPAGEGVSYGLRHRPALDTVVATVPVGYADGVPRRLFEVGGAALVHGRRCPVVGAVTMDQLMLDCGPAGDPSTPHVARGDDVVLIGEQGGTSVTADEWAERLGTIAYEVVTSIGPRLPRRYTGR